MVAKPQPKVDIVEREKGRFWQPPSERASLPEEARRWQRETADAAAAWSDWVEKNGVPLAKYRQF